MAAKTWLWLPVSAAALCILSCVPGDRPEGSSKEPPGQLPAPSAGEGSRVALSVPGGPKARVEAAIENVRNRELSTNNGFWTVFHGILGLGPSVTLLDPETNRRVNALDHIGRGGSLPVNTNGGLIGEAYIHGMNSMAEGVRQIRGTSVNQVANVHNVLVSSGMAGAILAKD